jgi:hypothetical protein
MRTLAALLVLLTACQRGPDAPPARGSEAVVPVSGAAEPAPMTPSRAYAAKQWTRCAELFTAAAEQGGPQRATNYYGAARCHALDGNRDAAFASLDLAVKAGFDDVHIAIDDDAALLRSDPRWVAVWKAVRAAHEAAQDNVRDKRLRDELLALMTEDQDARNAFIANMNDPALQARVREVDRKTTARLKEVIAMQGWPGKTLVGEDAAHAAWLLVQHADADGAFQRQCLALIEVAAQAGEATMADYAYLYDRVAVAEHRPQRYGTQYKDGTPAPIEDAAHVDQRREAIGLGTMAEYDAQMRAMYGKNLAGR